MRYAQFKRLFNEARDETSNQMLTEDLTKAVWKKLRSLGAVQPLNNPLVKGPSGVCPTTPNKGRKRG
jgi:hypothetical protein